MSAPSAAPVPSPMALRLLLQAGGALEVGELARLLQRDPAALASVLVVARDALPGSRPALGPAESPSGPHRVGLALSGVRLCRQRPEACRGHCGDLHLCRFYIYSTCTRTPCRFIHDINVEQNQQAIQMHGLQSLNLDEVRLLLLLNDPTLLPEPCVHYNRGDGPFGFCSFKNNCAKLHICVHFLLGDCRFGSSCRRSHELLEGESLGKLEKWGLSADVIFKLPTIYKNAFDIRKSSYSLSTESSSVPGPFIRSPSIEEGGEEICLFHIRKSCTFQDKCTRVHFHLPYRWQLFTKGIWEDVKDMEAIEKIYSDPNSTGTSGLDPKKMTIGSSKVRRLSTVSSACKPPHFVFTTEWTWYWKDECDHWNEYGLVGEMHPAATISSSDLEKAFVIDQFSKVQFKAGTQDYELCFKDMLQRNLLHKTEREVCRRPKFVSRGDVESGDKGEKPKAKWTEPLQEETIPSYWDKSLLKEVGYQLVHLADTSEEFKKIQTLFSQTLTKPVVLSIDRIQNQSLWEVYQWQKEQIKKSSDAKVVDERLLFHGTDEKLVESICCDNFDWRICGVHGTAYGKGSYFARDASYSHNYSKLTNTATRIMFVARVLVGDFIRGKANYLRPPSKNVDTSSFYNSCVDSESNPSIFVVFERYQIYPEYLIKYVDKPSDAISHLLSSSTFNNWSSVKRSLN